jgi:hypothetical protein
MKATKNRFPEPKLWVEPRNLFQSPDAENRHIRLVGRQVTLSRTPS